MTNVIRALGVVVVVMTVAGCRDSEDSAPETDRPISAVAQGRTGGPLPEEGCTWRLLPTNSAPGITLESTSFDGERGTTVWREDDDDVVWLDAVTFCIDAPTFVFGGVSDDVESVVLTSGGEQVVLDVLEVPGHPWGAVIGDVPRRWRSAGSLGVEVISKEDGTVLARESIPT